MTEIYRGQADVATWCGVVQSAVTNWVARFPGEYPEPQAEIHNEGARSPIRGWSPDTKPAWVAFAAAHGGRYSPRRPTASTLQIRATADRIHADMAAGKIDPATAAEYLHSLIGAPAIGEAES